MLSAEDRALIAGIALGPDGDGYTRLTEAFAGRGGTVLIQAAREADEMLRRVTAGEPVTLPDGTTMERDAPHAPTGNVVEAVRDTGIVFDGPDHDLITRAARGDEGAVAHLIAAFRPRGEDVLLAAAGEVDRLVASWFPAGYVGVVRNGTLHVEKVAAG